MAEVFPISLYEGFQAGNFQFEYIGKGIWRGKYIKTADKAILLNVDEDILFPFKGWRLQRIDISFDDATTKDIAIRIKPEGLPDLDYAPEIDASADDTTTSYVKTFEKGYEYILGDVLNILITGTEGKKATPIITVQQLRGLKKPPEQPLTTTKVERS